jgi:hypothetical protein
MRLKASARNADLLVFQDSAHDISTMKEKATSRVVDTKLPHSDMLPLGGSASSGYTKRRGPSCILLAIFSVLCILASAVSIKPSSVWSPSSHFHISEEDEPLNVPANMDFNGNGLTMDVLWDKYSLVIKGQRLFIQ